MPLTKSQLLSITLILSLIINVYAFIQLGTRCGSPKYNFSEGDPALGGFEVSEGTAKKLTTQYANAHPNETRGFILSRLAFEKILKTDSNSIAMFLVGKDSTNLHLVVKGVNTEYTKITDLINTRIFQTQAHCPALNCLDW